MMEWGLVPFFSKDGKRGFTTFNARGEELQSKPMYGEPFKTRRCKGHQQREEQRARAAGVNSCLS